MIESSTHQGLNERDIEMDNLKTIIIALDQKVKSRDDLEIQLKDSEDRLVDSNNARI
jgi:hypothetical protein